MAIESKHKTAIPRYQQIAVEVAARIANGEYQEGEKIYARSSLASQYSVSPETARRAICILCDLGIVTSEKGNGIIIRSQKKAAEYIQQNSKRQTIDTIKENLLKSVSRQKQEMEYLNDCLKDLIEASVHFRSMNPFMPFEIRITSECAYLNKTVTEIQFWQRTGATVIAVSRNDTVMKSPGPYVALSENDTIYFVTQDDSSDRVKEFLYPSK
ncbi:TrkA C-terminal domain-containing protein [Clostridium sp. Marseille-P2415]|uniref:TrkA C-terminal domain-containing protein n=1 Tax=Clostridium sp. Marseille-P2415 TaxID=1805471 RepID=UPI0009887782|nr:TrkA C-terminal domain-containing protein [Clostridium sp. Marseille-P2415]